MSYYKLERVQFLPITTEAAWEFFSAPRNLKTITPPHMGFDITSGASAKIYAGQIITYVVRPVLGIPMSWMTEITHVEPGSFFVDEQRIGPYKLWHHQHHFRPVEGGVEMTDIVHYQLPMRVLGRLAHVVFVRKQLEGIFEFRKKKMEELFF